MKKNLFASLALLLVIIGLVGIMVWGITKMPTQWLPLITAGIGFLVSRLYETLKENKTRLYEKKREVYTRLLYPWLSILIQIISAKDKKVPIKNLSSKALADLAQAAFDAILYASDDVIKAYGSFRTLDPEQNEYTEVVLGRLTKLLKSIRKDLGNTYSNLKDIEILQMFMNLTPEEKIKFANISQTQE